MLHIDIYLDFRSKMNHVWAKACTYPLHMSEVLLPVQGQGTRIGVQRKAQSQQIATILVSQFTIRACIKHEFFNQLVLRSRV